MINHMVYFLQVIVIYFAGGRGHVRKRLAKYMAINFCELCQKRHNDTSWRVLYIKNKIVNLCSLYFKPVKAEFMPESVKNERPKYAKSTLQAWREGEPSAEFIEAYPERAKKMFTQKELLTAKPVWKGDISKDWRKSQ